MDINRENIDEHLFEYFEGEMSLTDSDFLMDFIHQNPSYEKDFIQWQKSYHHVDDKLESFGINNQIKKIARIPIYQFTWFKIAAPTLIIVISAIGLNFMNLNKLDAEQHIHHKIEFLNKNRRPSNRTLSIKPKVIINDKKAPSARPDKHATSPTIPIEIPKPIAPDTSLLLTPLVINNTDLVVSTINPMDQFPLVNDSLLINEIDSSEIAILKDTTIAQDSVSQTNQPIIEPIQSSKKAKKRKASRTTKALPINPNF